MKVKSMESNFEIDQLFEHDSHEYVRRFFENKKQWEAYAFHIYSDPLKDALSGYLSSHSMAEVRLYRLVEIIKRDNDSDSENEGEIELWMHKMADDFNEFSIISDYLFKVLDTWVHQDATPMQLYSIGKQIKIYLDYIGNSIYQEMKKPVVYVTDLGRWRKAINAKSHVEILIRYFNDRLSDENEYKHWITQLPPVFKFSYHDFPTYCTGIYTLFFHQMLSLTETSPFIFTALSRQTKMLITLCFHKCRWDYIPTFFGLSERFHVYRMFSLASDMILSEKLYDAEEFFPEYRELRVLVRSNKKQNGGINYYVQDREQVQKIKEPVWELQKNLSQMMYNWLILKNTMALKPYIDERDYRVINAVFEALKTLFNQPDYKIENQFVKKAAAKLIREYPPDPSLIEWVANEESRSNVFQKTDYHEWMDLWEKAQE